MQKRTESGWDDMSNHATNSMGECETFHVEKKEYTRLFSTQRYFKQTKVENYFYLLWMSCSNEDGTTLHIPLLILHLDTPLIVKLRNCSIRLIFSIAIQPLCTLLYTEKDLFRMSKAILCLKYCICFWLKLKGLSSKHAFGITAHEDSTVVSILLLRNVCGVSVTHPCKIKSFFFLSYIPPLCTVVAPASIVKKQRCKFCTSKHSSLPPPRESKYWISSLWSLMTAKHQWLPKWIGTTLYLVKDIDLAKVETLEKEASTFRVHLATLR